PNGAAGPSRGSFYFRPCGPWWAPAGGGRRARWGGPLTLVPRAWSATQNAATPRLCAEAPRRADPVWPDLAISIPGRDMSAATPRLCAEAPRRADPVWPDLAISIPGRDMISSEPAGAADTNHGVGP